MHFSPQVSPIPFGSFLLASFLPPVRTRTIADLHPWCFLSWIDFALLEEFAAMSQLYPFSAQFVHRLTSQMFHSDHRDDFLALLSCGFSSFSSSPLEPSIDDRRLGVAF